MGPPDVLHLGVSAQVTLQRAHRAVPGGPLPRASGTYPLRWIDRDQDGLPPPQLDEPTVVAPVGPGEAAWLSFRADEPTAVQLHIDGRNAITGVAPGDRLDRAPQDYIVLPEQHWLDGVRRGENVAEQIMGPPSGSGDERSLLLVARRLRAAVFRQWWIDTEQDRRRSTFGASQAVMRGGGGASEAGAEVRQEIVPDPFNLDDWDSDPFAVVAVRLIEPSRWAAVTGEQAPPTPAG